MVLPGRQILDTLKNFQPYQDARRLSIYLSMPAAEIQTDAIVRHALGSGKQVFVPYLYRAVAQAPDTQSRVMDMVHLRDLQDYESLKRDRWGIPSVDPSSVEERQRILGAEPGPRPGTLDLMLLPGVAFDVDEGGVRRLGHGRGFYDFFLNRYFASTAGTGEANQHGLLLYGLALKEQLVTSEAVPTGSHDRKLHGLLLGDGTIQGLKTGGQE